MNENTVGVNYEYEYQKLLEEKQKLGEQYDESRLILAEKEKHVAFLNGQIEAFRFCVSRGVNYDR